MSLALIQESAKEVRRLAIAGSPLAVGDFRLKKLAAPLEQAGAKVPVFAQVAKAINDVVNGKESDSATNLLNLSTLLNAILYTQGQSGADGDFCELETFSSNCSSTRTPARVLKPLVQALTSTGGGRYEIVKTAFERGAFNDLRLIDPAIQALGDNYPELADFVAEKVLPAYGPGIVLRLKSGLDLKGKKQDARRLQILHQLDPAGTLELCKTALEDGSPEVKVAAIACLGKQEDCLPLVMEQASAKNKLLRAAALEALAAHDRPDITKLFTELVKGKALDILAGPFRSLRNRQVLNSLLDEGKRIFRLLLKGNSSQLLRYWEILDCLDQRKDVETEEFLTTCFNECDKLAKLKIGNATGTDIIDRLAKSLYEIGSPKSLETVIGKRDVLPVEVFSHVFRCIVRVWPPAKVFDEFASLLEHRTKADKTRRGVIECTIRDTTCAPLNSDGMGGMEPSEVTGHAVGWDPRWLDAAIKADEFHMVGCLAKPGHKAAIAYLLKAFASRKQFEYGSIIQVLARCKYPAVTDQFIGLVKKMTKSAKTFDWALQQLFESARHLPAADLPKLDAFAATLDEKFMDSFLEALGPLRNTNQPT